MSDKEHQDLPEEKASNIQDVRAVHEEDWLLQSLTNMANTEKMSFGITLNVGGFLVSGTLIGGKEYFNLLGETFASVFDTDEQSVRDVLKESFSRWGYIYDGEPKGRTTYIHMKNVRFFSASGSSIPSNETFWRGRLSHVDGFVFGSLS